VGFPSTASGWRNWSGSVSAQPAGVVRARDERAVAAVVSQARRVKALGSGHSFTAIAATDGVALDVGALRQVTVAADEGLVTCGAGLRIGELARTLAAHGLALENQGDIDRQTVAGAIATATHGTGARFRSLSAQVERLRLVDGRGQVRELAGGDELAAGRVALGALGVVTAVTLRCVPLFGIRRVDEPWERDRAIARFPALAAESDHCELFVLPYGRRCLVLRSERTPPPAGRFASRVRKRASDLLLANGVFALHCQLARRAPRAVPRLNRLLELGFGSARHHDLAYRVYAHPRLVRFNEMEYALPLASVGEAVERVLATIERRRLAVCFPLEVRVGAAEDALLAPAHGRETAYVAVHQYAPMPYLELFAEIEREIFLPLGGRPHWGKWHSLDAAELAPRYPGWERFRAVRARLDPTGKFRNGYLDRVLGPPAGGGDAAAGAS